MSRVPCFHTTELLVLLVEERVSPVMVLANELNGHRCRILPLVVHENLIQHAVSVAAAFYLLPQIPDLREPAEAGRSASIKSLFQTAQMATKDIELNRSTWATIILLIISALITGHADVIILFRKLTSFLKAGGCFGTGSPLEQFLLYQAKI